MLCLQELSSATNGERDSLCFHSGTLMDEPCNVNSTIIIAVYQSAKNINMYTCRARRNKSDSPVPLFTRAHMSEISESFKKDIEYMYITFSDLMPLIRKL